MPEKSPSNPFIKAVEWEAMAAFMKIRAARLVARATEPDEEYIPEEDRYDVYPTTQLFV